KEDPERVTLPFVAANIAAAAGQESSVLCTIEAVWVGTEGGADGIAQPGLPVLADLYGEFVDNGGKVWLCGACTKPRGISEEQLAKGSTIVGAAKVVEEVISGATAEEFALRGREWEARCNVEARRSTRAGGGRSDGG